MTAEANVTVFWREVYDRAVEGRVARTGAVRVQRTRDSDYTIRGAITQDWLSIPPDQVGE